MYVSCSLAGFLILAILALSMRVGTHANAATCRTSCSGTVEEAENSCQTCMTGSQGVKHRERGERGRRLLVGCGCPLQVTEKGQKETIKVKTTYFVVDEFLLNAGVALPDLVMMRIQASASITETVTGVRRTFNLF